MLMQNLPFHSEMIVIPLLLDMNQSPLPRTESKMLNSRQHQHIVFAIHTLSISFPLLQYLPEDYLCQQ